MKPPYLPMIVIAMLMLISCSEEQQNAISSFGGQLSSILDLKHTIDGKLKEGESGVNINNNVALTISLVNTGFNRKSAKERQEKAHQLLTVVTEFITRHENLSTVKYVTIAYVKYETRFLIVNFNETIDYYSFNLDENRQSSPESGQQQPISPGSG